MSTQKATFTEHQVRTIIHMAEAFQAHGRKHADFPWDYLANSQEWMIQEAFPVLERTAKMAGIDTGRDTWMFAVAGTLGFAIACHTKSFAALPSVDALNELARGAVGYEDKGE